MEEKHKCPYMTIEECQSIRQERDRDCRLMDDRLREAEKTTKSINKIFWIAITATITYIITEIIKLI